MTLKELWLACCYTNGKTEIIEPDNGVNLYKTLETLSHSQMTMLFIDSKINDSTIMARKVKWFDFILDKLIICLEKEEEK